MIFEALAYQKYDATRTWLVVETLFLQNFKLKEVSRSH
jgi:hypothetical protein